MSSGVSLFSLTATALYAVVTLAALIACITASNKGQLAWNRAAWLVLSLLFIALILLRGLGLEEMARAGLREALRSGGSYDERRSLQGIIASIVIVAVAVAGGWWLYRASRAVRGRRNIATMIAVGAGGAMLILVALRMISLHMIDRALYGALKLNWIGDIGTSVIVLAMALYYIRLVRARP